MAEDKKKILIVDDEIAYTNILSVILRKNGNYRVVVQNDARHAVNTALKELPDLIILDIVMAHKRGYEIAAEIKKIGALKDIPIIFVTATVAKGEKNLDGRFGGHTYIAKPSSLDQLLSAIKENLSVIN